MQPPAAAAAATPSIKVTIRSCKGNGRCLFFLEAPANVSIGDVKQLLCRPPHSMCSDASELVLVLKGKGSLNCHLSRSLSYMHTPSYTDLYKHTARCTTTAANTFQDVRSATRLRLLRLRSLKIPF